jgi:transposase-like protein
VQRPSYDRLVADVEPMSMLAVGRKYGVSDNAVRKWLRWYEYERERNRTADDCGLGGNGNERTSRKEAA